MLLGVTLAVEDAEDTERIEDLNEKARVMKELASMSAEEKEGKWCLIVYLFVLILFLFFF